MQADLRDLLVEKSRVVDLPVNDVRVDVETNGTEYLFGLGIRREGEDLVALLSDPRVLVSDILERHTEHLAALARVWADGTAGEGVEVPSGEPVVRMIGSAFHLEHRDYCAGEVQIAAFGEDRFREWYETKAVTQKVIAQYHVRNTGGIEAVGHVFGLLREELESTLIDAEPINRGLRRLVEHHPLVYAIIADSSLRTTDRERLVYMLGALTADAVDIVETYRWKCPVASRSDTTLFSDAYHGFLNRHTRKFAHQLRDITQAAYDPPS